MSDAITIPDGHHSPIGPSSFARVEACPSSALLSAALEPEGATVYAAEGTAAHLVMQWCLERGEDPLEYVGQVFRVGRHAVEFTVEHAEDLAVCVAHVRSLPSISREYEVKLSIPRTPMHGTSDVISMEPPLDESTGAFLTHVLDLKFGAGVPVSENSIQLAIYGLMAIIRDDVSVLRIGPDDEVICRTTVMQPRAGGDPIRSRDWTRAEMLSVLDRISTVIEEVNARTMRYAAGEHCRWCAALAICPYLRMAAQDAVLTEVVQDPSAMAETGFDRDKLDEALALLPALDLWKTAVTGLAFRYLEGGGVLTGAKLVEKRSARDWKDPEAAEAWLRKHGVEPFEAPKRSSPAQAEKRLPRPLHADMRALVKKESSGLTLASMDDPRPAYIDKVKRVAAAHKAGRAAALINRKGTSA